MNFFRFNRKLYPTAALFAGVFIIIFGLAEAKNLTLCSAFLGFSLIWLMIFGCSAAAMRIFPFYLAVALIFFGIFYAATGSFEAGHAMANRFAAVFLAVVPGMATEPVRMTRALSQMRAPRSATLGILIAMSFMPLLKTEIKRVREAMKTRNAGSVLNPPVFYRAFLVPFAMRLVSVSDTLALSVETRGFTIGKEPYTIYKKENFVFSDFLFLFGLTASAAVTAVL